jgi:hypothetical protein
MTNNCHCLVKQKQKVLKALFMLQYYETLTEYIVKYILIKDPTHFNRLPSSEVKGADGVTCRPYNAH